MQSAANRHGLKGAYPRGEEAKVTGTIPLLPMHSGTGIESISDLNIFQRPDLTILNIDDKF